MHFSDMETIFSDYRQIDGSRCYCSEDAGNEIRNLISDLPLHAVHFIGTGDFHYQTLFWLERIDRPFSLLLLDNHPDDQPGAFGAELLSCGNWVARARELPLLQCSAWIRKADDFRDGILPDGLPVYISVDLDILSTEFAHTDWDQGGMSLTELTSLLEKAVQQHPGKIIGVDICGGISPEKGGTDADMELNAAAGNAVAAVFRPLR